MFAIATKIPPAVEARGIAGIDKFISDHQLDGGAATLVISHSGRNGKPPTIASYHARWEDMLKFSYLRGDYQSATLLHRKKCPRNPYPLKPSTVAEYYDYKLLDQGRPLMAYGTEKQAVDVEGNPMFCQGLWHSKKCCTNRMMTCVASTRMGVLTALTVMQQYWHIAKSVVHLHLACTALVKLTWVLHYCVPVETQPGVLQSTLCMSELRRW
jgi:hypothetical protein